MINDINRNYCALAACILNINLTRHQSLANMGIKEMIQIKGHKGKANTILTLEVMEEVKEMYTVKKLKIREIAEIYGVCNSSVAMYLHKYNIITRKRGNECQEVQL